MRLQERVRLSGFGVRNLFFAKRRLCGSWTLNHGLASKDSDQSGELSRSWRHHLRVSLAGREMFAEIELDLP